MNYFVTVYDRSNGQSSIRQTFDAAARTDAMRMRFELEDEYRTNPDIEIVVLGADSKEALMHTHSRYFKSARDLLLQVQLGATSAP